MNSQQVANYYFDNYAKLKEYEAFHFISRLFLWNQDLRAVKKIQEIQQKLRNKTDTDIFRELEPYLVNTTQLNQVELRKQYFLKYPTLRPITNQLFKGLFAQKIFGVDLKKIILEQFDSGQLQSLEKSLLEDKKALDTLATYALNFLYLYRKYFINQKTSTNLKNLIGNKLLVFPKTKEDIQLHIYYLTHCVVGEAQFYTSKIDIEVLPLYQNVIKNLENIIEKNFQLVHLDNKLEFLVSCQICETQTRLLPKIMDEANNSKSELGDFIVDKFNLNPQTHRCDFNGSEHRNVLYIMANSTWTKN